MLWHTKKLDQMDDGITIVHDLVNKWETLQPLNLYFHRQRTKPSLFRATLISGGLFTMGGFWCSFHSSWSSTELGRNVVWGFSPSLKSKITQYKWKKTWNSFYINSGKLCGGWSSGLSDVTWRYFLGSRPMSTSSKCTTLMYPPTLTSELWSWSRGTKCYKKWKWRSPPEIRW